MTKPFRSIVWNKLRGHDRLAFRIRKLLGAAQYAEAGKILQLARRRFPKSETIFILAARICLLTDNVDQARELLKSVRDDNVFRGEDRLELADCYRQLRDYQSAEKLFRSVAVTGKLEQRRLATQSLVSVCLRRGDCGLALRHAVDCVRLGGWHHQHAITKLARYCSRDELRLAIQTLIELPTTDPWIRNNKQKMISQFAVSLADWNIANAAASLASKAALEAHRPDLTWDDSQDPLVPGVLVIGAMKAGTSALFHCLCSHPEFVAPQYKELHFFNQQKNRPKYHLHWAGHAQRMHNNFFSVCSSV